MLPLGIMIVRFPCKWNPRQFHFSYMKNCRSATQRINWFVTDIWQLVIRHTNTLICLQWYVLGLAIRLSVYTLLGQNKIKFGQKIFAPPKIWTPVHHWCLPQWLVTYARHLPVTSLFTCDAMSTPPHLFWPSLEKYFWLPLKISTVARPCKISYRRPRDQTWPERGTSG